MKPMKLPIPDPYDMNLEKASSALIVDIRDSTRIIRQKSFSSSSTVDNEAIKEHTESMMRLFKCVNEYIGTLELNDRFAFNDTGDGCLCVFWNHTHPLTCLQVALTINNHLSRDCYVTTNKIRFGIGCHTGGCLVYRMPPPIGRDFVFGIVANTAARVEKFTKLVKDSSKHPQDDPRLVFTGNFKECLEPWLDLDERQQILRISNYRIDVNDGKEEGHFLYTLKKCGMEKLCQRAKPKTKSC